MRMQRAVHDERRSQVDLEAKHIHGLAVRPTFRPYFAEELLRSVSS